MEEGIDGFIFLNCFSYMLHCEYIVTFMGTETKSMADGKAGNLQFWSRQNCQKHRKVCPYLLCLPISLGGPRVQPVSLSEIGDGRWEKMWTSMKMGQ